MASAERSLVDANVLVYSSTPAAGQYQPFRALLESDKRLCVSPQVFAEFHSVVTNPRRATESFSSAEARAFINAILPRFDVLPMPAAVVAAGLNSPKGMV